ncbi:hypothetical protein ACFLUV_04390 [Elusimicrobiota bacterium]
MRYLSKRYHTYFLSIESLFTDFKILDEIKKVGVEVAQMKKSGLKLGKERQFINLIKKEKINVVIFDSIYTAKLYMSHLVKYCNKCNIIMDARDSQYLMYAGNYKMYNDEKKKVEMLEKSKPVAEKEMPIFCFADGIIVKSKTHVELLQKELPCKKIIELSEELNDIQITEFDKLLRRIGKEPAKISEEELEIKKVKLNNSEAKITQYNKVLKEKVKEYTLVMPGNAVVGNNFIEKLLFCMGQHPDTAVVVPLSNIEISRTTNSSIPEPEEEYNFSEFVKSHEIGNFGEWRRLHYTNETCFLVKNKVIEQVGLLDERFTGFEYALMDLCYRIKQAGYRIMNNREAFIYYEDNEIEYNKFIENDQRLLLKKWGITGAEVLESLK